MKREILWLLVLFIFVAGLLAPVCQSPSWADDDEWIVSPANDEKTAHESLSVTLSCAGKDFSVNRAMLSRTPEGGTSLERAYIPLEDEDMQKFLRHLGAFFTWSSQGDVLCINSSGRDLYFGYTSSSMKSTIESLKGSRGFIKSEGLTYLPLADLVRYLGLRAVAEPTFDAPGKLSCRLGATLDSLSVKDDEGTRSLMLHTSIPVNYRIESEDSGQVTVVFPETQWTASQAMTEDFQVSHESTKDQGLRLRVVFPANWDGRLLGRMTNGTMPVELMPHFPLKAGYRAETLEEMTGLTCDSSCTLKFLASGPMHYFYQFRADEKKLIIDLPLVTKSTGFSSTPTKGAFVKEVFVNSFTSGYGATRITLNLRDNVTFQLRPSDENPYALSLELGTSSNLGALPLQGSGATAAPENCGTIVIDPGHGGCDPGACNSAMGLKEKDLTLDMATQLARTLQDMGWKVVMTRSADRDVSWAHSPDRVELQARADVANINSADAFLSIHCNAAYSSSHNGSSLHWCKDSDYGLAKSLQGLLGPALGLVEKGLFRDSFYVLSHTRMPAVLVETAFISNAADASKLGDRRFRENLARTIARGLDSFMGGRFARKGKRTIITRVERRRSPESAGATAGEN
jgi:N-acetylmuramoyl-L-alanine amidase